MLGEKNKRESMKKKTEERKKENKGNDSSLGFGSYNIL